MRLFVHLAQQMAHTKPIYLELHAPKHAQQQLLLILPIINVVHVPLIAMHVLRPHFVQLARQDMLGLTQLAIALAPMEHFC